MQTASGKFVLQSKTQAMSNSTPLVLRNRSFPAPPDSTYAVSQPKPLPTGCLTCLCCHILIGCLPFQPSCSMWSVVLHVCCHATAHPQAWYSSLQLLLRSCVTLLLIGDWQMLAQCVFMRHNLWCNEILACHSKLRHKKKCSAGFRQGSWVSRLE